MTSLKDIAAQHPTLTPTVAEVVQDKLAAPAEPVGTLGYARVALKAKDGTDGLLYIHRWKTGNQELIFPSEDAADRFGKIENLTVTHKRKPTAAELAKSDREAIAQGRLKGRRGYKANRRAYDKDNE
jgi:hypothetical protein